ncbi:hypothetical protein Tco_1146407 [Tanacetum coccineum]
MKRVNTFTPMESDDTIPKVVAGSLKIDVEQELNQESSKRQKIGEGSEPAEESKDELSQKQLQQLMIIVPEEGMNVEAPQTKYWEVYTEDLRKYWKIIRVGNHTEVYQIFEDMLKNFNRDDLVKLWSLVHERFNSTEPTEDKEIELWVELKRLFEPDDDDTLWKLQRYMHDPLKWRLYDTCVVHHVSIERGHDIFMLVEKDYPLTRALMTLMCGQGLKCLEASSQHRWFNSEKLVDLNDNHKFRYSFGFSDSLISGNPTPSDPIIASFSPSITPFEGGDFILEEVETFLCTPKELSNLDDDYYDTEGDILYLEKLLNEDSYPTLPPLKNDDLKQVDVTMMKPSIKEPPELELKDLPSHLEYAFLEGTDKLPVIISKELKNEEKAAL